MFREMRRWKQALTKEQCEQILTEEKRGVLAVLGDEGYPYTVPINFYYEDGKIFFHGAAQGHKADAIRACDKVSFCVMDRGFKENPDDYFWYVNSVVVFGRMRMLEDREEVIAYARKLGLKYFPTPESVEEGIAKSGHLVQCFELTIEHMSGKLVHEE